LSSRAIIHKISLSPKNLRVPRRLSVNTANHKFKDHIHQHGIVSLMLRIPKLERSPQLKFKLPQIKKLLSIHPTLPQRPTVAPKVTKYSKLQEDLQQQNPQQKKKIA
jgi:hypothetical protein